MICKTCNVPLVKSMALQNKTLYIESTDPFGSTLTTTLEHAKLVDCMKCPKCGHAVTI